MKKTTFGFLNHVIALFFSFALLFGNASHAQNLQAIPQLTALVIDQTGTLNATEIAQLDTKLKTYQTQKGSQIGVLIVATTAPEDIFSYAQRAAETYKLGRKNIGDGVLIVIAKNDRKMHVYVMRALEGAIPDAYAKRVINEQMQPAFKQNQFAAGLNAGVDQLQKLINGEQLVPPSAAQNRDNSQNGGNDIWTAVLMLTLAACFIGSNIARASSRWVVAPIAAVAAGFVAAEISSIVLVGGGVAAIVGFAVLVFGKHYAQLATQRSSDLSNILWGSGLGGGGFGGGFGGSSSGGGWGGSGGGGDAGGGGASGDW